MDIRVVEIRLLNSNKPLKAFCDARVNTWIVHDFRIVKQNGQRAFVSPPQVSWKDPATGEIKYKGILTIPPEEKQRIDTEILHAYQVELEKGNAEKSK